MMIKEKGYNEENYDQQKFLMEKHGIITENNGPALLYPSVYGSTSDLSSPERDTRIFIFLGQSNMAGTMDYDEIPEEYEENLKDVYYMYYNGWGIYNITDFSFGPEISFISEAKSLYPDSDIGIIKVAIGSTGIKSFSPDWSPLNKTKYEKERGPLYEAIKRKISNAKNQTPSAEFMGVFWEQGWADATMSTNSENYLDALEEIITEIRKDTGDPDLPFFVGTYCPPEEINSSQSLQKRIEGFDPFFEPEMAVFEVYGAHTEIMNRQENVITVYHGYLEPYPGAVDFNSSGHLRLGEIFYGSYLNYAKNSCSGMDLDLLFSNEEISVSSITIF